MSWVLNLALGGMSYSSHFLTTWQSGAGGRGYYAALVNTMEERAVELKK